MRTEDFFNHIKSLICLTIKAFSATLATFNVTICYVLPFIKFTKMWNFLETTGRIGVFVTHGRISPIDTNTRIDVYGTKFDTTKLLVL